MLLAEVTADKDNPCPTKFLKSKFFKPRIPETKFLETKFLDAMGQIAVDFKALHSSTRFLDGTEPTLERPELWKDPDTVKCLKTKTRRFWRAISSKCVTSISKDDTAWRFLNDRGDANAICPVDLKAPQDLFRKMISSNGSSSTMIHPQESSGQAAICGLMGSSKILLTFFYLFPIYPITDDDLMLKRLTEHRHPIQ